VDAPPVVLRGLHKRRYPLIMESCCLGPRCKIRRASVLERARGLSWPPRLSGGAAFLERTSRGMALTRGATCPGRSGSRTRWLRSEGSSQRRLVGCPVLWPSESAGLPLARVGPVRGPGFTPPSQGHWVLALPPLLLLPVPCAFIFTVILFSYT